MSEEELRKSEIRLRVAGVTIRAVSSNPAELALAVPPASRQFLVTDGRPDIDLDVRWGDLSSNTSGTVVFDSGGVWRLFDENRHRVFRFWPEDRASTPFLECRVDTERWSGEVVLHRRFYDSTAPVSALQYPLDEILMVHHLGRGRGIELHACGVVTADGRGLLFAGQSGDGKSTTARLWESAPGTVILSDDRIVVREERGAFVMYGTPWHGEARLAADGKAPIDAIFVLQHGATNSIQPLPRITATALLGARCFVPFHDAHALDWSLGFLDRLADRVPCHRLAFLPDDSARSYVDDWSRRLVGEARAAAVAEARAAQPGAVAGAGANPTVRQFTIEPDTTTEA